MNKILLEDIKNINDWFDMSVFNGKTVLVTGATGLIGSLCVNSLISSSAEVEVIALVRNEEKAQNVLIKSSKLKLLVQDINEEIKTDKKIDYIIHTASTTSSKDFVEKPVETILTAINGTKNLLDYAKKNVIESMVYLSSIEVYGVTSKPDTKEKDYGYIDILNPRSSYSEGKRLVETLCISYGTEYKVPVKIARLTQIFGAGLQKNDNRIFAQFAKNLINGENIVLHTKGETARNYCYTADAITAIFTILTKGENNKAYNVANKHAYSSIADMAKLFENDRTKVVFEIDNKNRGYNPPAQINLDTTELEALGWSAKVPLKIMKERTVESLKSNI